MLCRHLLLALPVACALLAARPAARAEPGFLGKPAARWVEELGDAKPEVRRGAAFALGKAGQPSAVPALRKRLADDDAGVRDAAAYALGEIAAATGDASLWKEIGADLLKRLGEDGDAKVRRSAAYAAGCCGPAAAEARGALTKALGDAEPVVRQNAAWALGRLKDKAGEDAVAALAERLRDDDATVR